jgi:hypothetical protein
MPSISPRLVLLVLASTLVGPSYGHVVSISNGEMHIRGRKATFQLRIPTYEIEHTPNPEITLLDQFHFADASRTGATCTRSSDWFTCDAAYNFANDVPDKIEVECTLFRVTVPNHIHMLYAEQGPNSDQRVFDQSQPTLELRFHPPSFSESLQRDGASGALRLLRSVAALLFLATLVFAAQSSTELAILGLLLSIAQWLVRPLAPYLPPALSPEFVEALQALTAAYLAAELLFLPTQSKTRWLVVPLLGLAHGLPYVAYPTLFLSGAQLLQVGILLIAALLHRRLAAPSRRPTLYAIVALSLLWFTRQVYF